MEPVQSGHHARHEDVLRDQLRQRQFPRQPRGGVPGLWRFLRTSRLARGQPSAVSHGDGADAVARRL